MAGRKKRAPVTAPEPPDLVAARADWFTWCHAIDTMCGRVPGKSSKQGRKEMEKIKSTWSRLSVDATGADASCMWLVDGRDVVPNPAYAAHDG